MGDNTRRAKKKGSRFREPFYFLVAGAGFEPTTFGLLIPFKNLFIDRFNTDVISGRSVGTTRSRLTAKGGAIRSWADG
jgi:hypothetical protein